MIARQATARWLRAQAGIVLAVAGPAASSSASAATVVGIISERSAPELAAAASRFDSKHPGHQLILRTTEQLARLDDAEVVRLLISADAVLVAGVFREDADRLVGVLDEQRLPEKQTFIALHGDVRLTRKSRYGGRALFAGVADEVFDALTFRSAADRDPIALLERLQTKHPDQGPWLKARQYYLARGPDAWSELFAHLVAPHAPGVRPQRVQPSAPIRYLRRGQPVTLDAFGDQPVVAIVDYDAGDRKGDQALHDALDAAFERRGLKGLSVLARWGDATVSALEALSAIDNLVGLVVLQDFVLGGGSGRPAATEALSKRDVPVFKGLRLVGRSGFEWRMSDDGLPWDSVHYRVAMPELQGTGQPIVVATAGAPVIDRLTGLELSVLEPQSEEIASLADRAAAWHRLRTKANRDKRVAVIYYNHPPGRHNIGADNLDVPASLLEILRTLDKAGYQVETLPKDAETLLEQLQERGVNLPEDRAALAALHAKVPKLSTEAYRDYFDSLPVSAQRAMSDGPLALMAAVVEASVEDGRTPRGAASEAVMTRVERTVEDTRHLLEGTDHPASPRALELLGRLEEAIHRRLRGHGRPEEKRAIDSLVRALKRTGIEGLRGWGPPPGQGMVHQGDLLVPGIQFGNVFVGPQPPRGWELDEELLHANLAFAPPHQYLAFYAWLRRVHQADVLIHVGRHSTYEFLPGRRVGLPGSDFPRLVVADRPSVYIYVVDGVGEGIQAKRRGLATIVDHLTPSMSTTPLYDDLLELRQLVESFEAAEAGHSAAAQTRAIQAIKEKIRILHLEDEISASMARELKARGISFEQVDDELLVHEIGHYLTQLQERFMPFGLHVFGRPWSEEAVERMVGSMTGNDASEAAAKTARVDLGASPGAEKAALLAALSGRFVRPGKGNDPIRTPEALPTGRNFHALDGSILPTRVAWALGQELAGKARAERPGTPDGSEAVVLWASDTVRDEGAMVAFGLALLGLEPRWNSRGILVGLELLPATSQRPRRDVTFVTSGLFRDLYENLMVWLDRATLLALNASADRIRREHPALSSALDAAMVRLSSIDPPPPGDEPLSVNQVAAHWVTSVQAEVEAGRPADAAGRRASLRLFGNAPGGYGAGINRLAERSGAWSDRSELARAYLHRMGHAYGDGIRGEPAHGAFASRLRHTEHSYLGRASNLYGLLDNNDGFDYLGGLGLAVESLRGEPPAARVIRHADPHNPQMQALAPALLGELRGRHLNPTYLEALKGHGYAGARTLSQGFVENLWGWQVTSPDIVKSWAWDEVHDVLINDRHALGLDEFLKSGRNVHVLANIQAVLLVAASRGHWDADPETLSALAEAFAKNVLVNGLPGSGHTRPDHPVMAFVGERLNPEQRARFEAVLDAARVRTAGPGQDPASIAEIERASPARSSRSRWLVGALAAIGVMALLAGIWRGRAG